MKERMDLYKRQYSSLIESAIDKSEHFSQLQSDVQDTLAFAKWQTLSTSDAHETLYELTVDNDEFFNMLKRGEYENAFELFRVLLTYHEINYDAIDVQDDMNEALMARDEADREIESIAEERLLRSRK